MFTQYFGNYLYESGIISLEQFGNALRQMKDKRAKLGVLAIEAGYMTPSQVENTFAVQKQLDKKFGEIAVSKGYLTGEQLEQLLGRQSSPFSVFSQIMIESGAMSYAQLADCLESYRKKCGMSAENFARFKSEDITPVVEALVPQHDGDPQRDAITRAYLEIFVKSVMRFISDNVTVSRAEKTVFHQGGWFACQHMTGARDIIVSFSGSEDAMRFIAGKFAKEEYFGFGLLVQDVLGEFLNCCDGVFTANALELGVDLDLDPQYVTNDYRRVQTKDQFSIDFSVENYQYQLNLGF